MRVAGIVSVGCSVGGAKALKRVLRALEDQGAEAPVLTQPDILPAVHDHRIRALVYDLEPGDGSALSTVRDARRVRRELPIWLYYPLRTGFSGVAAEAGSLPGVWTTPQMAGQLEESEVGSHIARLVSLVPELRLRGLVRTLVGPVPLVIEGLVESCLQRLERGGRKSPKIQEIAAEARTSPHRWEERCAARGLPPPKHVLDCLSLLHTTFMSWSSGASVAATGMRAGLTSKDLYRLRVRVLGSQELWHKLAAVDQFALAAMALAKACNVSTLLASEAVESFVKEAVS